MAATLAQMSDLGHDSAFIARVRSGALYEALQVEIEPTATTNHAARLAFANKVVQSPDTYAAEFAALLPCGNNATQTTIGTAYASTNPPSASNVADADILTLVGLAWNIFSGV